MLNWNVFDGVEMVVDFFNKFVYLRGESLVFRNVVVSWYGDLDENYFICLIRIFI